MNGSSIKHVVFTCVAIVLVAALFSMRLELTTEEDQLSAALNEQSSIASQIAEFDNLKQQQTAAQNQLTRDVQVLTSYYRACREVNDLQPLDTEFVIHGDNTMGIGADWRQLFSVPKGMHTLQIQVTEIVDGKPIDELMQSFPLLASGGYEVHLFRRELSTAPESPLVLEIKSNLEAFETISKELPMQIFQVTATSKTSTHALAFPNEFEQADAPQFTTERRGVNVGTFSWLGNRNGVDTKLNFQFRVMSDSPVVFKSSEAGWVKAVHPKEFLGLKHSQKGRFVVGTSE